MHSSFVYMDIGQYVDRLLGRSTQSMSEPTQQTAV